MTTDLRKEQQVSIYDRARDALKSSTPGPWEIERRGDGELDLVEAFGPISADRYDGCFMRGTDEDIALAAIAPELAAAVVRAADLADSLEASWESAPAVDGYKSSGAGMALHAALGIRAALEGGE